MDEVRQVIPQVLALTGIALPSFDDEALVWGDATPKATIARLSSSGIAEVAVKDAAGPVVVLSDGAIKTLPMPFVDGIRDTTGAGDGFNAGYLSARLFGQTPEMAASAGQRFSGEVVRHLGARLPKARIPCVV